MNYYCSECSDHGNWLNPLGFKQIDNIEQADLVIFGGGSDVDPATYGEKKNPRTYSHSARDIGEKRDFKIALEKGIPMYGICRGIQFLCAMAGGKLIQHVNNHGGSHRVSTFDELVIEANSMHHQMINPYGLPAGNYKILAWTPSRLSNTYLGETDKSITLPWDFKEIEAAYFPKINAMGVQYHPEMMYGSKNYGPVMQWTQNTFTKFFNKQL